MHDLLGGICFIIFIGVSIILGETYDFFKSSSTIASEKMEEQEIIDKRNNYTDFDTDLILKEISHNLVMENNPHLTIKMIMQTHDLKNISLSYINNKFDNTAIDKIIRIHLTDYVKAHGNELIAATNKLDKLRLSNTQELEINYFDSELFITVRINQCGNIDDLIQLINESRIEIKALL